MALFSVGLGTVAVSHRLPNSFTAAEKRPDWSSASLSLDAFRSTLHFSKSLRASITRLAAANSGDLGRFIFTVLPVPQAKFVAYLQFPHFEPRNIIKNVVESVVDISAFDTRPDPFFPLLL
jgi:hypothetical protein